MKETSQRRTRVALLARVLLPLLAVLALVSWGVSSPVGSSPDDDFHLASIWCGDGDRANLCEAGSNADERFVPESLGGSICYAFKSNDSAACQSAGFDSSEVDLVLTDRGNFTGDYPPVFYWVMGLFAGPDVSVSVIMMRAFNVLLFVGMFTALFAVLPARRRTTLVWGTLIAVVPLGMFLIPSTNPSSWALISAGTFWIALLGYFETAGLRRLGLGGLAAISLLIGAGARADAAIYSILAIVAVVCLSMKRDRRFFLSLIYPAVLACVAALFYLSANQSSFAASGIPSSGGAVERPGTGQLIFQNFLNVPGLWAGAFGTWGLGWLDTLLPAVVWVAALAVYCVMVFTGLGSMSWRKGLAVGGVFAVLWLMPTYILVKSGVYVGAEVQPRYILPLLVILGGVALIQVKNQRIRMGRAQAIFIIVGLSVANSVALHFNIRRYVTGLDFMSWNLDKAVEWWWGLPITPMTLWAIGSLAFAAVMVLVCLPVAALTEIGSTRLTSPLGSSNDPARESEPGFVVDEVENSKEVDRIQVIPSPVESELTRL